MQIVLPSPILPDAARTRHAARLAGLLAWLGRAAFASVLITQLEAAPDAPAAFDPVTPLEVTAPADLQEMVLIKSVFDDSFQTGNDPFFPNTDRAKGRIPQKDDKPLLLPELTLNGISISANHRLAMINNYTLAEGEERDIRVENNKYKVRLLEVRERSVVISYRGQSQELRLKTSI